MSVLLLSVEFCVRLSSFSAPTWHKIFWRAGAWWQSHATRISISAQICNHKATVLHHALPHKLNKVIIDKGRLPSAFFILNTLTTFGKLPTPATQHLLSHDVRPIPLQSWRWISIGAMLCAFKNFITDRTSQAAGEGIRASILDHCYHANGTTHKISGWHVIDTS